MLSIVTSKNVSGPRLIWPTLYMYIYVYPSYLIICWQSVCIL